MISTLLLNIALHGLEHAAGVRYITSGRQAGDTKPGSPVVIRYADDRVALCHSRQQAEQVQAMLTGWLAPRGLTFNEEKTRIVHLGQTGFDILGFNVRRYNGVLLIKPSTVAIQRIRERLRTEMRALRGTNAAAILAAPSPDHSGLGGLLPGRGVVQDIQIPGQLPVDPDLHLGHTPPREQAEKMGHRPILRHVQQVQE